MDIQAGFLFFFSEILTGKLGASSTGMDNVSSSGVKARLA